MNINKVATLRNARGGNVPDLLKVATDCERFGADGITVHPRPDERHIRYADVRALKEIVLTELNVEGNPTEDFMRLIDEVRPDQVTLVPDSPDALTSNAGWDCRQHGELLRSVTSQLREWGIRSSIFLDPDPEMVSAAARTGTDRIELYTEQYAIQYPLNPEEALAPYIRTAELAIQHGLGLNAGHDLSLENLKYFSGHLPGLLEVSIGHALISDALYLGLDNTIKAYKNRLNPVF